MAENRAGFLKVNLSGEAAYRSFVPAPLPPNPPLELDDEMVRLLMEAGRQLATLEVLSAHSPSGGLFVSMQVRKEALMSSRIEGIRATLEDVLDPTLEDAPSPFLGSMPTSPVGEIASRSVASVINYVKATEFAIERRKGLPLCNRLIRETHAVLMKGVCGQEKSPGKFRRSQNWVGRQGSTLQNARYIPPNVKDMTEALSDFERYLTTDNSLEVLIRAALIHYQFQTIHPFREGNGRIGRLLVTLFLMEQGVLSLPVLSISCCLKKNRVEYYDRMTEVRNKGSYEQWVRFFLRAILESAQDAVDKIKRLAALRDTNREMISRMGRAAKTTALLLAYLEQHPIIEIRRTAAALHLAFSTVSAAVDRLCEAGILVQSAGQQRNRTFSYEAYLDLLREGT
jgi:Fic family protein